MENLIWAAVAAWAIWLAYRRSMVGLDERTRSRAVVERILDRFSSVDELLAFVRSDEGKQLLDRSARPPHDPRRSVMRFLQAGILVLSLGVAFMANAVRRGAGTDINDIRAAADLRYWGTASVAIGAGLLIAAAVSWALARHWQLLTDAER